MKLKYIAVCAMALSVASCDILDKEPSNYWDSEGAIQTLDDVAYAVNGVYETQTSSIDKGENPRGAYVGDFGLYADMKGNDYTAIGLNAQAADVYQYSAIPSNSACGENIYRRFYMSIARANKVLSQIAEAGLTGEDIDAYKGELLALRGMFHFDLARVFAKLPTTVKGNLSDELGIVLASEVYDSKYITERAPLDKTYEAILKDLTDGMALMKASMEEGGSGYRTATQGHMNYWAALALRARVHLYIGDKAVDFVDDNGQKSTKSHYELALEDAKKVIDESGYSLYKRADYTAEWAKEFTSESLFEIQTTSAYNVQRNSTGYYTHAEGYAECGISSDFKNFLLKAKEKGDVRGEMIKEETDVDGETNKGWYTQKYPGRNGEIYVNNARVIRLSEVYLIAAEAALSKSPADQSQAVQYIDALRAERIEGYSAGQKNTITLDEILDERRLELNGENHYAWDMWRNGKTVTASGLKENAEIKPEDYRTVMPIPENEITVSGGKLKQNPGYN